MDHDNVREVARALRAADDILITAHVNPEGDSMGSQIAVAHILKKAGKNIAVVDQDPVPDNLMFLDGVELVKRELPGGFEVGCVLILDCPVPERAGSVLPLFGNARVINVDHHVSNTYFGDVNWVSPGSSSVGEMIFFLAGELGIEVDIAVAEAIYSAIVTDTGMFNYDNTSRRTHEVAGELIALGVDPRKIHSEIYESREFTDVRMLGRVLSGIELEAGGRLAHICISAGMYGEEGVVKVATEDFINYARSVKGVEVAVFFKQDPVEINIISVSFRSVSEVDVNSIAMEFGGGGHPKAAGCTLKCGLEKARTKVLEAVRERL